MCGAGGRREGRESAVAVLLGEADPQPREVGPGHLWHRNMRGSSDKEPGWPAARPGLRDSPDQVPGSLSQSGSQLG